MGDTWDHYWKVTAIAVCGYPQLFEGLQRVAAKTSSGWPVAADETLADVSCPAGKRTIAIASRNSEANLGEWYLDRFSRRGALAPDLLYGQSYRNSGLSNTTHYLFAICTDM
jgi:hypothetical protein